MAKTKNNLNISIFTVLKASELSKVPVLLLSNPGVGKTSTVYMFAKIRGYEVVLLRGNSTSAEEVMGYDVSPQNISFDKPMAACHLRPSWFEHVLRNKEAGKKTLLFLDELTTANEFVQAALLHLIFERKCGTEELPEDTLIVSAGNYFSNLSNQMSMLPPVMNRFLIFNVIPDRDDLDVFLNKYEGAIASDTGTARNYMYELEKILAEIDQQEIKVDECKKNKIGEYIERGIRDTTRMLMTTNNKPLDLSVTDLQDIYTDNLDGSDTKLYGFVSLRTLNYLRDVTLAYYLAFGKAGIGSDNYRNSIDGLCGLGLSKDSKKSGESGAKKTRVGKEYFDTMNVIVNDIEKMNNSKIPEYEKFFINITNNKTFDNPQLQAIVNKITELQNDKELANIERPIDSTLVINLCKSIKATGIDLCKISMAKADKLLDRISAEEFIGMVTVWNTIAELMTGIDNLVTDNTKGYRDEVVMSVRETTEALKSTGFKLRSLKRVILSEDASLSKLVPEVKSITKDVK